MGVLHCHKNKVTMQKMNSPKTGFIFFQQNIFIYLFCFCRKMWPGHFLTEIYPFKGLQILFFRLSLSTWLVCSATSPKVKAASFGMNTSSNVNVYIYRCKCPLRRNHCHGQGLSANIITSFKSFVMEKAKWKPICSTVGIQIQPLGLYLPYRHV